MRNLPRIVTCCLALTLSLTVLAPAARADDLWTLTLQAKQYEAAGQVSQAIPLWEQLAPAYAAQQNYTNAALFYGKLGKAYDAAGRQTDAIGAYEQEGTYWRLAGHWEWAISDLDRAKQLRSTVELFVRRPAKPPSRPLAKFEPPAGAIFGAYTELDPAIGQDFDRAAQTFAKKLGAMLIYQDYGAADYPRLAAQRAVDAHTALQIALQPVNGLGSVGDDAYLHDLAAFYRSLGIPIFLRFACEMNGEWVHWHTDPETYKAKFRLVADVMHREAPNVAMVWSPGESPATTIESYYPGDDAADWVGLSMYDDYYASGDVKQPNEHVSPLDRLAFMNEHYGAKKPIMISEWGVANHEYTTGKDVDAWAIAKIEQLYGGLPRIYPSVKAVFYWDKDEAVVINSYTGTAWSNHRLTQKPAVLAAFKRAIESQYYLSTVDGTGARYGYEAVDGHLDPQVEVLSTYAKLYDPIISKVEYRVNGQVVGSRDTAPYSLKYDFQPYDGERIALAVDVYDSTGKLASSTSQSVQVGLSDISSHWAKDAIRTLVHRGSVTGYPDGTFRPDETVSRAGFYTMLAKALGLPGGKGDSPFADLAADHWSYPYARALVDAGILKVTEYAGARLEPGSPIPRQEMAALVARAAHLTAVTPTFPDRGSIRPEWQGLVGAAAQAGIVSGFPDGTLGAASPASRAQAAVLIGRLMSKLGK